MTAGIHSLPEEILRRILAIIGQEDSETSRIWAQRTLEVTARVCKLWNIISTELLYKEIAVDEDDSLILLSETFLLHNPARCNLVQRLEVFGFDDGPAPRIICNRILACEFPAMREVYLDDRFTQCLCVMPVVPFMGNVRKLRITGKQLPMFNGSTFPNLRELSLEDFRKAPTGFQPSFPHLERLSLRKVKASAPVCAWLKVAVTRLKVLRVDVGYMSSTGGGVELFRVMPEDMEELEFISNRDQDVLSLARFLPKYRNLRRLILSSVSATSALEIVPSNIEVLELRFDKVKVDGLVQLFKRLQRPSVLPHLKQLSIGVDVFRTAPTDEVKEACRTAYERLTSRGASLCTGSRGIERFNIWNMDAPAWQQEGPAPPHPLEAMFPGIMAQGNQNPLAAMLAQNGMGDDD